MYNPFKRREDSRGSLNYMVAWQTIDGRLQIQYHETEEIAVQRVDHLRKLNRTPTIWVLYDTAD